MENMRTVAIRLLFLGQDSISWYVEVNHYVWLVEQGRLNPKLTTEVAALTEELKKLEEIDVFRDPQAEWMFAAGVINRKLLNIKHLKDEVLINAATSLYSRLLLLYPVWLDMTRVPRPEIQVQDHPQDQTQDRDQDQDQDTKSDQPQEEDTEKEEEEARGEELVELVRRRFGIKEGAEITAEELAAELHARELSLKRGT
jgi:hypothetical protein